MNRSLMTRLQQPLRTLALAAAALTAGLAVAQPASGPMGHGPMGHGPMASPQAPAAPGMPGRMAGRQADPVARLQQHLERVKADLKLQAGQEAAWQQFTRQALDMAEAHKARRDDMQRKAQQAPDPKAGTPSAPDLLAQQLDRARQHLADLEKRQQALKDLYAALSPEQRKIADLHFHRMHAQHDRGGHGGHGPRGHHGMGHHGMGMGHPGMPAAPGAPQAPARAS
jgi:hypothetical protein